MGHSRLQSEFLNFTVRPCLGGGTISTITTLLLLYPHLLFISKMSDSPSIVIMNLSEIQMITNSQLQCVYAIHKFATIGLPCDESVKFWVGST